MRGLPSLIGMVHLPALPGAPGHAGDLPGIVDRARGEARLLAAAGFDGIMVENFGDAPFFADDVPKLTVAAMARVVGAVVEEVEVPVGVNVLRNDALASLAVAAATGASFVRVNVLGGLMITDQGPIVGRAAEVVRFRDARAPGVRILADVFVKHAVPPPGLTIDQAARDLAERAGADALVVSGTGTGAATAPDDLRVVRATTTLPVLVGSGATEDTIAELLARSDGVIVGSALKEGGVASAPLDPERVRRVAAAAGRTSR